MLLSAGYSTRLGELSGERPKPLLPVCDIPILRYGVALLAGHGVTDVVINLHHHANLIESEIPPGLVEDVRIHYIRERDLLDTGGGLKNALALLDPDGTDEPFVSMNGKLIFDLDLGALLADFRQNGGDALGMMVVRRVPDAMTWGALDVTPERRVRNILGGGHHMFCGVHVTRPSVIRRLPDGKACMVRQGYLPWLQAGELVMAHEVGDQYFCEHSTPERYLQSNLDLLAGAILRHPPDTLIGIDDGADIAGDATIVEPVRIARGTRIGRGARVGPLSVIGRAAVVEAGATVERSVLWPGATAGGHVAGAIVTRSMTVRPGDSASPQPASPRSNP